MGVLSIEAEGAATGLAGMGVEYGVVDALADLGADFATEGAAQEATEDGSGEAADDGACGAGDNADGGTCASTMQCAGGAAGCACKGADGSSGLAAEVALLDQQGIAGGTRDGKGHGGPWVNGMGEGGTRLGVGGRRCAWPVKVQGITRWGEGVRKERCCGHRTA